jgi:N-acetylglucosaminyl-diphospho-decaprenol L-rhamnosyltransferase
MTPDVDVIIVNFNTRAELAACLSSLHDAMPRCVSSVVVVDNGSTDGSVEMLTSRWPQIHVIANGRNLGFGAANNVALRQCREPLALLLNSDTVVRAGAIDALRERMLATGAVAAGPKLVDAGGRPEVSFGPMLSPVGELAQRWRHRAAGRSDHWAAGYLARYLSTERFVDWVSGACLLLDVRAGAAAGFFDERYFMYEEDVDLCAALRSAGGRILFAPAAEVVHLRGRSTPAPSDGLSHYDRSHLAFYEKHLPGWAVWLRLWLRLHGRRVR